MAAAGRRSATPVGESRSGADTAGLRWVSWGHGARGPAPPPPPFDVSVAAECPQMKEAKPMADHVRTTRPAASLFARIVFAAGLVSSLAFPAFAQDGSGAATRQRDHARQRTRVGLRSGVPGGRRDVPRHTRSRRTPMRRDATTGRVGPAGTGTRRWSRPPARQSRSPGTRSFGRRAATGNAHAGSDRTGPHAWPSSCQPTPI